MRKIVLMFVAVMLIQGLSAQVANKFVSSAFSKTELKAMTPDQIDYLNFLSEKAAIVSYAPEKAPQCEDISVVSAKSGVSISSVTKENFNFHMFNFVIDPTKSQVYKIGDSGNIVMIYSQERLNIMYERYKKSNSSNK